MFNKRLELIFILVIILSIAILSNNYRSTKNFKNHPIPDEYKELIVQKEQEILTNMQKHYGFSFKVPLIVTDRFKDGLYGATNYKNGKITIYLNKNVMQESMEYMLDSVIAHEYAHALMFKQGLNTPGDGHSLKWRDTCVNLGAKNCERYVDMNEVVMGKMPF